MKKSVEAEEKKLRAAQLCMQQAVETGKPIDTGLRNRVGTELLKKLDLQDDANHTASKSHVDDEYAFAGIPKILLTTSRDPSSRLVQFSKELTLVFPNCKRINRGQIVTDQLIELANRGDMTDIVILHEHRGKPDGMIISHLPLGPTLYFEIRDVVLRHDLKEKPDTVSQVYPHIILHHFSATLGQRIKTILQHLFPPANPLGRRCVVFINMDDEIVFRHFFWEVATKRLKDKKEESETKDVEKGREKNGGTDTTMEKLGANRSSSDTPDANDQIELIEVGPRFSLRPFKIELGTLEMKHTNTEWALKPYFNSPGHALGRAHS